MEGMTKSVIVVGTGGYALELVSLLKSACISVKGCIGPKNKLSEIWLGPDDELGYFTNDYLFVVAIGDVQKRSEIVPKIPPNQRDIYGVLYRDIQGLYRDI